MRGDETSKVVQSATQEYAGPHKGAQPRRRTRKSAKNAGGTFERTMADYFAEVLNDDRIDRRVKRGKKDRGDLAGLRVHGQRLVAECKNVAKLALGTWAAEAEVERGNDDALAGVIIHKRHGKGQPADQWVTMTARDFAAIISGERTDSLRKPCKK